MNITDKCWSLIGVRRKTNGCGEINYCRKTLHMSIHIRIMIEIAYWLGLNVIAAILIGLNIMLDCLCGAICSYIGIMCGMLLIPIVISIVEGYGITLKSIW